MWCCCRFVMCIWQTFNFSFFTSCHILHANESFKRSTMMLMEFFEPSRELCCLAFSLNVEIYFLLCLLIHTFIHPIPDRQRSLKQVMNARQMRENSKTFALLFFIRTWNPFFFCSPLQSNEFTQKPSKWVDKIEVIRGKFCVFFSLVILLLCFFFVSWDQRPTSLISFDHKIWAEMVKKEHAPCPTDEALLPWFVETKGIG